MVNEPTSTAAITLNELFKKLERPSLTASHYKLVIAAVIGDMSEYFNFFIIGFVLAFIVVPWHLSFGATTVVLLSAGVGSLAGAFFFGWLADRIGRMPVLYLTTAMFTLPSGILYFTPEGNWAFLAAFRFLVGTGVGGLYPVLIPLVQEFMPARVRGLVSGIVTTGIPAGALLGSLCAAFLTRIGWRGLFLIGLAPSLAILVFRLWMRESPRWLVKRGRCQEAVRSLNWVTGEHIDYRNVIVSPEDADANKPSFSEIFKFRRSVGVTWTACFLQSFMDYGFVLWAPSLLVLVMKITPAHAAKMFIPVAFASIVGKVVFAYLSEIVGRRVGGVMIGVGSAATCLIVSLFWNSRLGGVPVIYAAFIALYGFISGGWSITGPYSTELWPQSLRATGMGSAYGMAGLGKILGPMILAIFAGSSNLVSPKATAQAIGPTYLFFGLCGLALAVAYYFGRETRNKSMAEIEAMLLGDNQPAAKGAAAGR